jgi:hypothetical protein
LFKDARTKFQEKKLADGAVVAQKLEVKWEGAPPIEHMDNDTMQKFFPEHAKRDVRSDQHWFCK